MTEKLWIHEGGLRTVTAADGSKYIEVVYTSVDPTEAPPEPPEEPVEEPVEPVGGVRGPLYQPTTRLVKKIEEPGVYDGHLNGYLTVQSSDVTLRNLRWDRVESPATGDHMRIDAVGKNIGNITIEHFWMGGKPNPEPPHHIDSLQILGLSGGRVGNVTLRNFHMRASASAALFAGKNCLQDGAVITIENGYIERLNHGARLYAPEGGGCKLVVRRSEIERLSLVGEWELDVDDESIMPDSIGRV